ncbi:serine/threonine-protein kinase [Actinocorallia longicatena]|uniref:non-specific serine/threonine protein kinase n=1 Tax=Actinocorallia longicatena TaxID=111803 RepID=A0ABP6QJW2_9ACTN
MDSTWTVPGYRHVRDLGAGASGRVVMAEHVDSGIQVAIKYLSADLFMDPEFVGRFREEARLLAALEDPNLVQFFEYVETGADAAIVMELINGVSLSQMLADAGALSPEASLAVLKGSLLGLAAAHANRIVHRDYKPGNVLVDGEGNSMLADFGIAVRAGMDVQAAGTPAYMPPEQWSGSPVTPAADVYAATAVAYECMTGARPYAAKTLPELAAAHQSQPVPIENVPEPIRPLIAAGLAKDLSERPQTADALLWELETIAGAVYGEGWEERGRSHLKERALALLLLFPLGAPLADAVSDVASTVLQPSVPKAPQAAKAAPKLGLLLAAGAAVVALFGSGAFVLVNTSDSKAIPQAAPLTTPKPDSTVGGETPTGTPTTPAKPGDDPDPAVPVTDPSTTPLPSASPSTSASPSESATPGPDEDGTMTPTPGPTPKPTTPKPTPTPTPTPTVTEEPEPEPEPEPVPVQVAGLGVSVSDAGANLTVTVTVRVTGDSGTTSVTVYGLRNGRRVGSRVIGNIKASGTYTVSFAGIFGTGNCDKGSASANGDGVSAASGTVTGSCVR